MPLKQTWLPQTGPASVAKTCHVAAAQTGPASVADSALGRAVEKVLAAAAETGSASVAKAGLGCSVETRLVSAAEAWLVRAGWTVQNLYPHLIGHVCHVL